MWVVKYLVSVIVIGCIFLQWLFQVSAYSNFYYWHCTWYVWKNIWVDWRGNAKDWLVNASIKWHTIGKYPRSWAIVVFYWYWYNRLYGHVWIVESVRGDYMIISEMNYRRLWEITYRKIKYTDIKDVWYIYKKK